MQQLVNGSMSWSLYCLRTEWNPSENERSQKETLPCSFLICVVGLMKAMAVGGKPLRVWHRQPTCLLHTDQKSSTSEPRNCPKFLAAKDIRFSSEHPLPKRTD
eukprot:3674119-Amphidinium_carterae.1